MKKILALLLLITLLSPFTLFPETHREEGLEIKLTETINTLFPGHKCDVTVFREQGGPYRISILIEGNWNIVYDEEGRVIREPNGMRKRSYQNLPEEKILQIENHVKHITGFDPARGDTVLVQSFLFDREKDFELIDAQWDRNLYIRLSIIMACSTLVLSLIGFIIWWLIGRELKRRVRLREEELMRQHEIAKALAEKEDGEE